jgi:hypothetical protein
MCSSISKGDDKFITTDYLQQCPNRICSRHRQPECHVNQPREKRYEPIQFFWKCAQGQGARRSAWKWLASIMALVELEPAACATLRLNRPAWNVIEEDLRRFDGRPYQGIDLVAGGVPCPPFSKAGKQLARVRHQML